MYGEVTMVITILQKYLITREYTKQVLGWVEVIDFVYIQQYRMKWMIELGVVLVYARHKVAQQ